MNAWILITLAFSPPVVANEAYVKVAKLQAEAKLNGQPLNVNQMISVSGKIETAPGSFIVLQFLKNKDFVRLNESSSMEIAPPILDEHLLKIQSGILRIEVEPNARKTRFSIKTDAATMGVRGTNFFVKADPVLGETELIVFNGVVIFTNNKNINDAKTVQKGQWGGIGGRFGKKTSDILTLPESLLKTIDHSTSL